MADPNSPLTRFRRWLAIRVNPVPDAGETWCLDCALNGRRTLILPADSYQQHAWRHREEAPGAYQSFIVSWPPRNRDEEP